MKDLDQQILDALRARPGQKAREIATIEELSTQLCTGPFAARFDRIGLTSVRYRTNCSRILLAVKKRGPANSRFFQYWAFFLVISRRDCFCQARSLGPTKRRRGCG